MNLKFSRFGTGGFGEVSSEINTSTTSKETKKYSYTQKEGDDALSTVKFSSMTL